MKRKTRRPLVDWLPNKCHSPATIGSASGEPVINEAKCTQTDKSPVAIGKQMKSGRWLMIISCHATGPGATCTRRMRRQADQIRKDLCGLNSEVDTQIYLTVNKGRNLPRHHAAGTRNPPAVEFQSGCRSDDTSVAVIRRVGATLLGPGKKINNNRQHCSKGRAVGGLGRSKRTSLPADQHDDRNEAAGTTSDVKKAPNNRSKQ